MAALNDLLMPKLGLTMTEGTVANWRVAIGEPFAAGQVITEIETDKIVSEVEAETAGALFEILVPEGEVAPVSSVIARWQNAGEAPVASSKPEVSPAAVPEPIEKAAEPVSTTTAAPSPQPRVEGARIVATPYARRLADERGVRLAGISGSGPNGRIRSLDVLAAASAVPATVEMPAAASPAPIVAAAAGTLTSRSVSVLAGSLPGDAMETLLGDIRKLVPSALPAHLVAMSAMRALRDEMPELAEAVVLDLGSGPVALARGERLSLTGLLAALERADQVAAVPVADVSVVTSTRVTSFQPALEPGRLVSLGAVVDPVSCALSLCVAFDSAAVTPAAAATFLDQALSYLERPLFLLAS